MFDVNRYDPPLESVVAQLSVVESSDIVGIDGRMGAGKTALARWLAQQLGWQRYSLDDSIPAGGGQHQRQVARASIQKLQAAGKPVLVEGARLLETISAEEMALLIFLADDPRCLPSGRHQRAVENYLKSFYPRTSAFVVKIF